MRDDVAQKRDSGLKEFELSWLGSKIVLGQRVEHCRNMNEMLLEGARVHSNIIDKL